MPTPEGKMAMQHLCQGIISIWSGGCGISLTKNKGKFVQIDKLFSLNNGSPRDI